MHIQLSETSKETYIEPDLFGGNMEITRRTGWQGLSAQLLANRKFAAMDGASPCHWEMTGDAECAVLADSVCRSNSVLLRQGAALCQTGIPLCGGKEYILTVYACTATVGTAEIAVTAGEKTVWRFTQRLTAECRPYRYTFTMTAENDVCTLTVSCPHNDLRVDVMSLLPADSFYGMRRDVVDSLKTLGLRNLRFPGGCYAEVYEWKDGLLPADERPPIRPTLYEGTFLMRYTDGVDCHEIGTNEFMMLCREIGATPTLTVPVIAMSADNALDWLEYCNGDVNTVWGGRRKKQGFPEPFAVRNWCIGNEIYYFGGRMADDPVYAAETVGTFIDAMKARDPSVFAIVAYCSERTDWNECFLHGVGKRVDALSVHFYMTDEFKPNFGRITAEMCRTVLEDAFIPMMDAAYRQISDIFGRRMPLYLDEWSFTWGQQGNAMNAYVDAQLCSYLCAYGEKYGFIGAMYFHPVNEGMLVVEPYRCHEDYFGQMFRLYTPHSGARRLSVAGADPHQLIVVAGKQPDGRVYITAINRSDTQSVSLQIDGYIPEEIRQFAPSVFAEEGDCAEVENDPGAEEIVIRPGGVVGAYLSTCI